ncbi:DUF4136 domain-containing protein [Hydrogenovibrio halophilus]|uniref:DUF4136 domain-containing protein n=1 Tax=Hydrogenovibrio halophilus TaxID=373391 RepID=UPI00037E27F7|nr:DUF4136 domain-containing protein [Hydrogenovibrio halophilus]
MTTQKRHPKNLLRFLSLGLIGPWLLWLSGCSTVQVSHDYERQADFSQIQSLSWLPAEDQTAPKAVDFAKDNPLIAKRIEQAIEDQLPAKGLKLVDADTDSDAYMTYHASTEKTVGSSPFGTSIGMGTGTGSVFGGVLWRTNPDIETQNESVLKIDLLDQNHQLIWRGTGTTVLPDHPDTTTLDERIHEMVQEILQQYPPKP